MSHLVRFGVSMDAELLSAFDHLIERKGYANRSEALRDLAREAVVSARWADKVEPTVAALCLVYDHHLHELSAKLTSLQHDFKHDIASTLHVHLDHRYCLEVIILRGPAGDVQAFADRIIALRGVKHGKLVMTATGAGLD